MSRYDPNATVSIPIRVDSDRLFRYFYGGPLPELKPGTIGELVVSTSAVVDPRLVEILNAEEIVCLLEKGATLFVIVNPTNTQLPQSAIEMRDLVIKGQRQEVVRVIANEEQKLRLRGSKPGTLEPASWVIPSLSKTARSLNEAYRLISEVFEPHRRSHTGNVFEEVCYVSDQILRPLDDLRSAAQAKYEGRLKLPNEGAVLSLYKSTQNRCAANIGHVADVELKCQRVGWFAAIVAALAAFVGLIGSVYQDEIVRAVPFVIPRRGMTLSYQAFFFWLALFLLAGCVYLRQVADDQARSRLTDSAEAAEKTSRRIESLVETLPPRTFQTELARAAAKVHAVASAALAHGAAAPKADALASVIRHVLHSIASLALVYDDRPRISGREAKYSANIMLFVPSAPLTASAVSFFPAEAVGQLAGVLHLRRELSTTSIPASEPEPDSEVPEIRLPLPRVKERAGRSTALPGAPYAFMTEETSGYQNTDTLLEWCRTKGDFAPSVIADLETYFSTGAGRSIKSFISTPLANRCGVLNIHADRPDILGPALQRREVFLALVTPVLAHLADLVAAFARTEARELNQGTAPDTIGEGSAT